MITVEKARDTNGVFLKGDFFDFDRLYFAIIKYTGDYVRNDACPFPGCGETCENLLGLCYELRHAWQGDRNIEEMFNGIQEEWFDDHKESSSSYFKDEDEFDDDFEDDFDIDCETSTRFDRSLFPNITEKNAYFSVHLTFPEAIFYALILSDLLEKKDMVFEHYNQLAEQEDLMQQLHKEYILFNLNEDIARMTLFINHTLHKLYQFIGETKYLDFINKFKKVNEFSVNCDLQKINDMLESYGEKEYGQDDPETLLFTINSFLD